MSSQLQLIIGPMFSGKSTELLKRCKKYNICKYNCILIKYLNDTRYSNNQIITHDKQYVQIKTLNLDNITNSLQELNNYDVIGIDEGQFFKDIDSILELLKYNKIIIIAALDATFEVKPFQNILNLIPYCENVIKLNSICMKCYSCDGTFTKRIVNDNCVELIGGIDKYQTLCRKCFYSN
jgi:thymidine kinase